MKRLFFNAMLAGSCLVSAVIFSEIQIVYVNNQSPYTLKIGDVTINPGVIKNNDDPVAANKINISIPMADKRSPVDFILEDVAAKKTLLKYRLADHDWSLINVHEIMEPGNFPHLALVVNEDNTVQWLQVMPY